jgi:acetylornithine deacetylase
MLNAHVDVVPPGDLDPWGDQVPFSGTVSADAVHGRGACDMKAGLVSALWTVRAFAALRVPLRGDLILGTVVGEEDRRALDQPLAAARLRAELLECCSGLAGK